MLCWDAFFQRYRPMARAIAETLVGRNADAEDLVQEAALSLFSACRRDRQAFESTEHARNYYLRTVRNLAARRHERRRSTAPLEQDPPDPSPAPEEAKALEARQDQVARSLRDLPAEDRDLVLRRFLKRESLAEISAATKTPISTLHNRERRILKQLRGAIERLESPGKGEHRD